MKHIASPLFLFSLICTAGLFLTIAFAEEEVSSPSPEEEYTVQRNRQRQPLTGTFAEHTTWTTKTTMSKSSSQGLYTLLHSLSFYSSSSFATPNAYTFTDINGDGLPDFLYHMMENSQSSLAKSVYFAVFLNTGENDFSLLYKCAGVLPNRSNKESRFYGDCANDNYVPGASVQTHQRANVLLLMSPYYPLNYNPNIPDQKYVPNHATVDINGDGLLDVLSHNILLNMGNFEFVSLR